MSDELAPRLPAHAENTIRRFLRAEAGGTGVVLGLSGGIDSALGARLARDALGADRVLAVALPDGGPSERAVAPAEAYARSPGIEFAVLPLAPIVAALRAAMPTLSDPVDVGNMTARIRMTLLYALARPRGRRVLGTSNKSELLLGYFTKFGDGAADLLPLGDLYKGEVVELAERLGLPRAIIDQPPTAGFWEGQTDEGEFGRPYRTIDRVLHGFEELLTEAEIAERTGLDLATVVEIARRVRAHRHKRRLPPIPKLADRTVGLDWRD